MTTEVKYTLEDFRAEMDNERPTRTCGALVSFFNAHTGRAGFYRQYCNNFRDCVSCRARRGKAVRKRATTACARAEEAGKPWPQFQIVPEKQAAAFRLKLKRHGCEFLRAPVTGERVWFLHDACETITGSRPLTTYDLAAQGGLDWERIALTPEHKRTSGELGRPDEDERPSDAVLLELTAVQVPDIMPRAQAADLAARAERDTASLAPESLAEVLVAVRERAQCYRELVVDAVVQLYRDAGNDQAVAELDAERDVSLTSIKRYVSPSKLEWEPVVYTAAYNNDPIATNEAPVRAVPVAGVDYVPAPIELMQNLA